jgi:hypothetical protein
MDAGSETGAGVDTAFSAMLSSLRAPTPKGAALLSDLGAITPTIVYTGPTRTPDQLAKLNVAADEPGVPRHKKKGGKAIATDSSGDGAAAAKSSASAADKSKKKVQRAATSAKPAPARAQ